MRETSDRLICDLGHFCPRVVPIKDQSRFEAEIPIPPTPRRSKRTTERPSGCFTARGVFFFLETAKKNARAQTKQSDWPRRSIAQQPQDLRSRRLGILTID